MFFTPKGQLETRNGLQQRQLKLESDTSVREGNSNCCMLVLGTEVTQGLSHPALDAGDNEQPHGEWKAGVSQWQAHKGPLTALAGGVVLLCTNPFLSLSVDS